MTPDSLEARILEFARDPETGSFEELALAVFERQFEALPDYRRRCEEIGVSPASAESWTAIPTACEASDSAGANAGPALVRRAVPEVFEMNPLQLLVGSSVESSSAALVSALGREAPTGSLVVEDRIDAKTLRSWLGSRQRDRKGVTLVSDPRGIERLVEVLDRRAVKFRLPPGSQAFCVVSVEDAAGDLAGSWSQPLLSRFGLASEACRRLLVAGPGATPLPEDSSSPAGRFRLPHWVRVASSGNGRFALYDLAALETPPRALAAATGLSFI